MDDESFTYLDAYEAIVERGSAAEYAARVAALRSNFEARTGAFGPDDVWFEMRSRAFWDDAITTQGFADVAAAALPSRVRTWVRPFRRAHRGLFAVEPSSSTWILRDVWSGAEFVLRQADEGLQDALASASGADSGFCDGRLVGCPSPLTVGLLPGAVFHPAEATDAVLALLPYARERGMTGTVLLDALLRMDRSLRALSRVKAAYAYRKEALAL